MRTCAAHTQIPKVGNAQSTGEASYPGYARIDIPTAASGTHYFPPATAADPVPIVAFSMAEDDIITIVLPIPATTIDHPGEQLTFVFQSGPPQYTINDRAPDPDDRFTWLHEVIAQSVASSHRQ